MLKHARWGLLAICVLCGPMPASGAAPPDRAWRLEPETKQSGFRVSRAGWPARLLGEARFGAASRGGGLVFDGATNELVVLDRLGERVADLPRRELTVGAWVSIDTPRQWGGIVGALQDNGGYEKGWVLGYDNEPFTFGLSTRGADDGDGSMTYMGADRPFTIGKWHHVVATYDGSACRLYVDGTPVGASADQSGEILYDPDSPLVIGAYRDRNERFRHDGRIREVGLLARALTPEQVASWHAERSGLSDLEPWTDKLDSWTVAPFLTWPTREAVSVTFELTEPARAAVELWHETGAERRTVRAEKARRLHQFRLDGLDPNEKYFYRVVQLETDAGARRSDLFSFRTAVTEDRSFSFVVIGDTQAQPRVVKRVSDLAYMHRPNLVLLAGDLVTTGSNKSHWTGHFFPNMQPLIGRVPLAPILGNHEQDAAHYYDYMDLPDPEHSYTLEFGNAEFFMIDGNRPLAEGSAQLRWLDRALAASDATWKFAVLHQPPYTSDSNDYGDTLKTTSSRGDANARNVVSLLEEHGVDICFSGHVHDYERTFPIRAGRTTSYEDGGVIYVTSAGGGGHLEDFDPANTWFGHKKARYHHLVYVGVNGDELEFQAIDERGRLFDLFMLEKRSDRRLRSDAGGQGSRHDHDGHGHGSGDE